jgi:hypothetical protein
MVSRWGIRNRFSGSSGMPVPQATSRGEETAS